MSDEASLPKVDEPSMKRRLRSPEGLVASFYAPLPAACVRKLDAEGRVNGKTWRDMRVNCAIGGSVMCEPLQAIHWFWWKRGLPACFTDYRELSRRGRAAKDAALAMQNDAGGEAP